MKKLIILLTVPIFLFANLNIKDGYSLAPKTEINKIKTSLDIIPMEILLNIMDFLNKEEDIDNMQKIEKTWAHHSNGINGLLKYKWKLYYPMLLKVFNELAKDYKTTFKIFYQKKIAKLHNNLNNNDNKQNNDQNKYFQLIKHIIINFNSTNLLKNYLIKYGFTKKTCSLFEEMMCLYHTKKKKGLQLNDLENNTPITNPKYHLSNLMIILQNKKFKYLWKKLPKNIELYEKKIKYTDFKKIVKLFHTSSNKQTKRKKFIISLLIETLGSKNILEEFDIKTLKPILNLQNKIIIENILKKLESKITIENTTNSAIKAYINIITECIKSNISLKNIASKYNYIINQLLPNKFNKKYLEYSSSFFAALIEHKKNDAITQHKIKNKIIQIYKTKSKKNRHKIFKNTKFKFLKRIIIASIKANNATIFSPKQTTSIINNLKTLDLIEILSVIKGYPDQDVLYIKNFFSNKNKITEDILTNIIKHRIKQKSLNINIENELKKFA